jgi:hypothetical protein
VLVCAVVSGESLARAEPSLALVLLEDPAAPDRQLAAAFTIQLLTLARVQVEAWHAPPGLPERIRAASGHAERGGYLAAVWVERSPGTPVRREAVLYVVGGRDSRALLEVVRVPADDSPDLERVLALKLSEVLSALRLEEGRVPLLSPDVAGPPAALGATAGPQLSAASATAAVRTENTPLWAAGLGLGPRLDAVLTPGWLRTGIGGWLAAELHFAALSASLAAGAQWFPVAVRQLQGNEVRLSEVAPLLRARVAWRGPLLELALRVTAAVSFMDARGRTAAGASGVTSASALSGALGVELAHALLGPVSLALFADLVGHAERHAFAVNGERVLDSGRVGVQVGLDVVLHAPFRGP